MLYRLEVENFYSIRDSQVLDLCIAPNVPDAEGRFAPIFEGSDLRVPKVIALYGANASGSESATIEGRRWYVPGSSAGNTKG